MVRKIESLRFEQSKAVTAHLEDMVLYIGIIGLFCVHNPPPMLTRGELKISSSILTRDCFICTVRGTSNGARPSNPGWKWVTTCQNTVRVPAPI